jgi:hypothetical protein
VKENEIVGKKKALLDMKKAMWPSKWEGWVRGRWEAETYILGLTAKL